MSTDFGNCPVVDSGLLQMAHPQGDWAKPQMGDDGAGALEFSKYHQIGIVVGNHPPIKRGPDPFDSGSIVFESYFIKLFDPIFLRLFVDIQVTPLARGRGGKDDYRRNAGHQLHQAIRISARQVLGHFKTYTEIPLRGNILRPSEIQLVDRGEVARASKGERVLGVVKGVDCFHPGVFERLGNPAAAAAHIH